MQENKKTLTSQQELLNNYSELSLKKLESIIVKNKYTYIQIKRNIDKFIYMKTKNGKKENFEVFKNKICKTNSESKNFHIFEYFEKYETDADKIFVFEDLKAAMEKFNEI
jgi:hypothetical protein